MAKHNARLKAIQIAWIFHIAKVHEFFVIPKLALGGAAIEESDDYILLENGYILKISNKTFENITNHHGNFASSKKMGTKLGETQASVPHEIFSAHLGKQLVAENRKIVDLARVTCALNRQLYQWQTHLINIMPNSAGNLLFSYPGTIVSEAGDAFLIQQCKKVWNFVVCVEPDTWKHLLQDDTSYYEKRLNQILRNEQ